MSCRCSDIIDCQNDIGIVGNVISDISSGEGVESNITDTYGDLAGYTNVTIIVDDMTNLMNKEKNLNSDIRITIPNLSSKCSNELSNLQSQLVSMQSEDRSYHEELARQERERQEKERESEK